MTADPALYDRLEQLAVEATPGPWYRDRIGQYHNLVAQGGWDVATCSDGGTAEGEPVERERQARANADYLAALHEHLPSLLSAARRATALDTAVRDLAEELATEAETYAANVDRLEGVDRAAAAAYAIGYGAAAARLRNLVDGGETA